MNLKIVRKDCKELMKFWAIFAFFWLPFLLKNHYFKWITEESSRGKFYFFEGLGLKLPFQNFSGVGSFLITALAPTFCSRLLSLKTPVVEKFALGWNFFLPISDIERENLLEEFPWKMTKIEMLINISGWFRVEPLDF